MRQSLQLPEWKWRLGRSRKYHKRMDFDWVCYSHSKIKQEFQSKCLFMILFLWISARSLQFGKRLAASVCKCVVEVAVFEAWVWINTFPAMQRSATWRSDIVTLCWLQRSWTRLLRWRCRWALGGVNGKCSTTKMKLMEAYHYSSRMLWSSASHGPRAEKCWKLGALLTLRQVFTRL